MTAASNRHDSLLLGEALEVLGPLLEQMSVQLKARALAPTISRKGKLASLAANETLGGGARELLA